MRRANIGCGSIRPEGWDNYDHKAMPHWNVQHPLFRNNLPEYVVHEDPAWFELVVGLYDYAVCSFMLQELDFHELPGALANIRAVLKPGGWLRILVVDIMEAFRQYKRGDRAWFPQDERTGDVHAAFCSYVTWFGESKSIFTPEYLADLLEQAGFSDVREAYWGLTFADDPAIMDLDSRQNEALIVEARA